MATSSRYFQSGADLGGNVESGGGSSPPRTRMKSRRIPLAQMPRKDHFSYIEPQINAEGIHHWDFDDSCPVDVLFFTEEGRQNVRLNRHRYFEVLYLCSGSANCRIQDRLLPVDEGDLVVIGGALYHRMECRTSSPLTIAALFFEPDLVLCDGGIDGVEYLSPFFFQDAQFPHIIHAQTGVPRQAVDLMLRIRSELPPKSTRARLAAKTYLKMLLMLLVNHYEPYSRTVETFHRRQRALDRLKPLFRCLGENCENALPIRKAARLCAMSESQFMTFFREVTGLSFVQYVNHYRVARAQFFLANTEESLMSISQKVGFCDHSYFGVVFRKLIGITPGAYRQRFRNEGQSCCAASQHADSAIAQRFPLLLPPA